MIKIFSFSTIFLFSLSCFALNITATNAQNLNGALIKIGTHSPAFLNFADEINNVEFDHVKGRDYYFLKIRSDKMISISYNGKEEPTGIGLIVSEGKRNHHFLLKYDNNYDINKDPSLFYDYSDVKELRKIASNLKEGQKKETDEQVIDSKKPATDEQEKLALREKREQDALIAQRQKEAESKRNRELLEKEQLKIREREMADSIALVKAQLEAKEQELLREKAQKEARELELTQERIRKQEELAAKEAQRQKDNIALERLREEQRLEEIQRKEKFAKAQEEAERQKAIAQEKREALEKLEKEKEQRAYSSGYTQLGLWQKYGSKGINVYDIPPEQHSMNNADFYLAKDTLMNFNNVQAILSQPVASSLGMQSQVFADGVTLTLEEIKFMASNTYYRIRIDNKSKDDFLMGATGLYWYNADKSQKMTLFCSYISYIGFFPLVPPDSSQSIVFVTRTVNMLEGEDFVLQINERRKEKGSTYILIPEKVYSNELEKTDKLITPKISIKDNNLDTEEPQSKKKKSKK